jgi:hypothetical protein
MGDIMWGWTRSWSIKVENGEKIKCKKLNSKKNKIEIFSCL